MAIYINASQAISPQLTFQQDKFLDEVKEYSTLMISVQPDFKDFFNIMELRRMSRIMKINNTTALESLKEAGIDNPGAINTGTGNGCIEDTEKFLNKMLDTNEGFLNPTTFIQSTHNTLGAQIALNKKCHNYNITYVQKTLSFEWALLDSIMLINEGEADNILVGGIDEITKENYELKKNLNLWKKEPFSNLELLNSTTNGTIPGEGAAFFVISSEKSENCYAKIEFLNFKHRINGFDDLSSFFNANLQANNLTIADIDLVLYGINGDVTEDKVYYELKDSVFKDVAGGYFKHLSGEFDTSSAFALWLASNILKNNQVPEIVKIDKKEVQPDRILIYNQDNNKNHSIIVLSKC